MLNEKALEAAYKSSSEWSGTLNQRIKAAITAYLEALLPADVKEVAWRFRRKGEKGPWSLRYSKPDDGAQILDIEPLYTAALLQAQAAREAAKDDRIAELEDEVSEAQQVWPEWAKRIYSFMRKQGYYEGAEDDIHLPDDLEEWFDEAINTEINRRTCALSKEGRDNG